MVPSSPLRRAIERGLQPDGQLADELYELEDYTISTRRDAEAICEALDYIAGNSELANGDSPLLALTSLFQDVEDFESPAFRCLFEEGIPRLIRVFDGIYEEVDNDDESGKVENLLFILKVLAMYGTEEGIDRVLTAAQKPLRPDSFMWHIVMSMFVEGHPFRSYVFEQLSDPLPGEMIGFGLLDAVNSAAIEGELDEHPFDCEQGWEMLRYWLQDHEPDHSCFAQSSTVALPYLSNPPRDELLALALDHVHGSVQVEAAWAAGRLGREAGVKILARHCLDLDHAEVARSYLTELGREDLIPEAALEPEFLAKAEFSRWLSHPNELGTTPDEMEIVDHRVLEWPPEREKRPFWLIKYRLQDEIGLDDDDVECGLVGSVTWCFFTKRLHERPPEDGYAIHCYWEMLNNDLINEYVVEDQEEYSGLLRQWTGPQLELPTITTVAELSPKLGLPGRIVVLVVAIIEGEDGVAVLDGPRSAWYPESEQPHDTKPETVLMLHVGRQLLGFGDEPDRLLYLDAENSSRDPERVVAAYEQLLDVAETEDAKTTRELMSSWSPLTVHFDAYTEAVAAVRGYPEARAIMNTYERLMRIAEDAEESIKLDVYDSHGVLGRTFDAFVAAQNDTRGRSEIAEVIKKFMPYWQNVMGRARLGSAAFLIGDFDSAENFLLSLREEPLFHRITELVLLATLFQERGDDESGKQVLIDIAHGLEGDIKGCSDHAQLRDLRRHFAFIAREFYELFPEDTQEFTRRFPSMP